MKPDGLLLVGLSAICTVAANLLMRGGVNGAGGFATSLNGLTALKAQMLGLAEQPMFVFGMLLYGVAALIWFRVLSTENLSTSYPLLISMTFSLVTLGAIVFFHERLSITKALGLLVILSGIWLITYA